MYWIHVTAPQLLYPVVTHQLLGKGTKHKRVLMYWIHVTAPQLLYPVVTNHLLGKGTKCKPQT